MANRSPADRGSVVVKEPKKLRRRKRKRTEELDSNPECPKNDSQYADSPTPGCSFGNWAGNVFSKFSNWLVSYQSDSEDEPQATEADPNSVSLAKNEMLMSWNTMDGSSGCQIVVTDLVEEESFQMKQDDLTKLGPGCVACSAWIKLMHSPQ